MLPFMQPKKIASIIMQKRSNKGIESETEQGAESSELMQHSKDLISAIHAKDETATAKALRAAHEHLNAATEPNEDETT